MLHNSLYIFLSLLYSAWSQLVYMNSFKINFVLFENIIPIKFDVGSFILTMPKEDPETTALKKELEDLIKKCKVS